MWRSPAARAHWLLCRQAAEGGDANALAQLGHMHANGLAGPASNATIRKYFQQAANLGDSSGQYGLGYLHLTGRGVPVDYQQAFQYFSAATEKVSPQASARFCGRALLPGCGKQRAGLAASESRCTQGAQGSACAGSTGWQQSVLHLTAVLMQGHLDAAYQLGLMHLNGWGTKASRTQAIHFWTLASHYSHALAMYNLAMLHLANPCAPCPALPRHAQCQRSF